MTSKFYLDGPSHKAQLRPLFSTIRDTMILPILMDLLVDRKEKSVVFSATDLENWMSIELPSEDGKPVSTCVSAKRLRHILNNHVDPVIECNLMPQKVYFKNGSFGINAETHDISQYPKRPCVESKITFDLSSDLFLKHLANAIKFVSGNDLRPSMTGVYLIDWNDHIYMVSTDAHCMYYHPLMKTTGVTKGIKVIIPAKGCRLLLSLFKKELLCIELDAHYITFSAENKTLLCRLIYAKYPAFESVIPTNEITFALKRKQMIAMLKMCSGFVDRSTKQIIWQVSEKGVDISGGDVDFDDDFKFNIPWFSQIINGMPSFKFALNSDFLLKILTVSNDEYVSIAHSGLPNKAIVIDKCCIIMPVMINE